MADWSTDAIAGITAVAGLGGTVLTGRFNMRALIKSHRRDDTTMMRTKIEELFSELDVIEAANSKHYPLAFAMARGHTPPEPIAAINFGKLRAIVALYFPDLQSAVDDTTRTIGNGRKS